MISVLHVIRRRVIAAQVQGIHHPYGALAHLPLHCLLTILVFCTFLCLFLNLHLYGGAGYGKTEVRIVLRNPDTDRAFVAVVVTQLALGMPLRYYPQHRPVENHAV